MLSGKDAVVLVVITFLVVILIYGSIAKFNASAKPKNFSDILCTKNPSPNPGGINYSCCYFTNLLPDGKPGIDSHEYCADCQLKSDGSYACGEYHQVFRIIGNTTGLPGRLGNAQSPSTPPPPSNETHVNNLPGHIGTMQQHNNPQQELHHKGSNNQHTQTGGQESTVTKKHKGSKTEQGTTQSAS